MGDAPLQVAMPRRRRYAERTAALLPLPFAALIIKYKYTSRLVQLHHISALRDLSKYINLHKRVGVHSQGALGRPAASVLSRNCDCTRAAAALGPLTS